MESQINMKIHVLSMKQEAPRRVTVERGVASVGALVRIIAAPKLFPRATNTSMTFIMRMPSLFGLSRQSLSTAAILWCSQTTTRRATPVRAI